MAEGGSGSTKPAKRQRSTKGADRARRGRQTRSAPELSIVVPFFNEERTVDAFFSAIEPVLDTLGLSYEFVCINDGSSDGTLALLMMHHKAKPDVVKIVDLSRNFGKELALTAGLDHTRGDAVIVIDADLQDDPDLIPRFVEKWREGYEVVYGLRGQRDKDGIVKRASAFWFYRVFNLVSKLDMPHDTGDFRLLDRRVVETLREFPERVRFMKGLFTWVGFRQTAVEYTRKPRVAGRSTWNYWRLWNFALDGITGFSTAPLRIWSYIGVAISIVSIVYAGFLVLRTIISGVDIPGYASLMVAVLFLGGVQLISLGVIGEYLSRVYVETKQRPRYLVARMYGLEQAVAEIGATRSSGNTAVRSSGETIV